MDKKEIRRLVRERVATLPLDTKQQKSTMLALAILVHPAVRAARALALFSPLPDEPQVGELIELLAKERRVLLPRVEGDVMRFYEYRPHVLAKGSFGIMEPLGEEPFSPSDIDVIIVPGVAFTADGKRMGRGKGFYDKYMSQTGFAAHKIAVCYAEQIFSSLPCEPHDVLMNEVIYR